TVVGVGKYQIAAIGGAGDHIRSKRVAYVALQTGPGTAAVQTGVDAATGAGEQSPPLTRVHVDGEDVGIFLHATSEAVPGGAAVAGLPREMGCAGVENLLVGWIEGKGDYGLRPDGTGRSEALPD